MLYQIDICTKLIGIRESFIEDSLSHRLEKVHEFCIPTVQDEICYRIYEYIRNPTKEYYLKYVKNHIHQLTAERIEFALGKGCTDEFMKKYLPELLNEYRLV